MKKLSTISLLHYGKLVFRSLLLVAALLVYIIGRARGVEDPFHFLSGMGWLTLAIAGVFAIEMLFRFFPSRLESMGCQKQFARNYRSPEGIVFGEEHVRLCTWRTTLSVLLSWLGLNGVFAALYFLGLIDEGILLLISLFYSVSDMICILFFCPFQTWFMKNKCCGSCRIYNWDYAMMFTPLILIPNPYAHALFTMALLLFLAWEISVRLHPERFSTATNAALSCANCREKLCHHKRQLRAFLKKNKERLRLTEKLQLLKSRIKSRFDEE